MFVGIAYTTAAIHLSTLVGVVVACLRRRAVIVGVAAWFALAVSHVAPLALLALVGSTSRRHAVGVYTNIASERAIYIRITLVYTVSGIGIAPWELRVITIRVRLAAGRLWRTGSKVALEPNAAIIISLANGRGCRALVVFAYEAYGPCAIFPALARSGPAGVILALVTIVAIIIIFTRDFVTTGGLALAADTGFT